MLVDFCLNERSRTRKLQCTVIANIPPHCLLFLKPLPCTAISGAYASLRASGKKADLALVVCDTDAVVGGTFTQNVMCAAPVLYCKDIMARKKTVRAVRIL